MRVHLNGGPMHDCEGFQEVSFREGMYSRVTGPNTRHEFEWDGWRSHD